MSVLAALGLSISLLAPSVTWGQESEHNPVELLLGEPGFEVLPEHINVDQDHLDERDPADLSAQEGDGEDLDPIPALLEAAPPLELPDEYTVLVLQPQGAEDDPSATLLALELERLLSANGGNSEHGDNGDSDGYPTFTPMQEKNDGLLINEGLQRQIDAERFFNRGLGFISNGDLRRAAEEFERAAYFYRQGFPYATNVSLYGDILFYQWSALNAGIPPREAHHAYCNYVGAVLNLAQREDLMSTLEEPLECQWSNVDGGAGVEFITNPPGALVYINGILVGNTPLTLSNMLKVDSKVAFVKEGYRRFGYFLPLGDWDQEGPQQVHTIRATLRHGVFHSLYEELQGVVDRAEGSDNTDRMVLQSAAEMMGVGRFLLVKVDRPNGDDGDTHELVLNSLWFDGTNGQSTPITFTSTSDSGTGGTVQTARRLMEAMVDNGLIRDDHLSGGSGAPFGAGYGGVFRPPALYRLAPLPDGAEDHDGGGQ